jgi:hypothetical protein
MTRNLDKLIADSDLVAVGHVGLITSAGSSVNAGVEIEDVLKGSLESKNIRVIFFTMGASSSPELNPGELYIFCLRALRAEESPVYGLAGDDPNAVIPSDDEVLRQIQTLVSSSGDVD